MTGPKRTRRWARLLRLKSDKKGAAAIEFAFIASILGLATLNVADFATYLFDWMQVNEAAEVGAQAAYATCPLANTPATANCAGLNNAVTAAAQSTTLGNNVTLQAGSPSEGWYCVNSNGALQYMAAVANEPLDCTAAGEAGQAPADYIEVQVTYTWTPIFPGVSVASGLTKTFTSSAWMRME